MKIDKKLLFVGLFIVSLIIILFVGRSFNPTTGERHLVFTQHGLQNFRKGLDVSGGTRLTYKIAFDKYEKIYTNPTELKTIEKTIEDIIMKNIDGRVSKLGVSDYKDYIQNMNNQDYIVVELGGIADLDQAKKIIGKTLELEFKLQNKETPTKASMQARSTIASQILEEVTKSPEIPMQQLVEGRMSENIYSSLFTGNTIDQLPEIYQANKKTLANAKIGEVYGILKGTYTTVYNNNASGSVLNQGTGTKLNGYTMFSVIDKKEVTLSGKQTIVYALQDVFVQDRETWIPATDEQNRILNGAYFNFANTTTSEIGEPVVVINLNDQGKEIFCTITSANVNNPMAIFVGGNLLTAPNIQTKICGGTAQINGGFTVDSAKELASALNEGTLPAPLILMQEEKISPTLGTNALTGSLWAGVAGFFAIMMLIYCMYGTKKMFLTAIVMITFLAVLGAFMKLTDYALSLSGIAAIILSIGLGVDANILIYERLREELRDGKSISGAIDHAKERSWTAIRDGQISTGLIAFVLFSMGTNMFKGFGSMMIVTMLLVLFLNVHLTKLLLHIFYDKPKETN